MPAPSVPFPPMEAELVRELPDGDGWQYEPKWDGFRGVLENVGGELALWSRNERPLLRYFPELRPLGELLPPNSALDGEIVIARDGALDFDAMQTRLHPAESRIRRLSAEIPAEYVVFDMLLWDGEPVWKLPLDERRARVEALARLPPLACDARPGRGARPGSIASRRSASTAWSRSGSTPPYLPGSREAVVKVKEHKTADCVVARRALEGRPQRDRDAAARALSRRRRGRLRRLVRRRRTDARRGRAAGAAARSSESSEGRFSEPNRWGTGELEEAACARSSSSRCATTRCRATGSATARS